MVSTIHLLPVEFAEKQQAYPSAGNHMKRRNLYQAELLDAVLLKKQYYAKLNDSTPSQAFFECDGVVSTLSRAFYACDVM